MDNFLLCTLMNEYSPANPPSPTPSDMLERKNRRLVARVLRAFFFAIALYIAYRFGVDQGRNTLSTFSAGSPASLSASSFLGKNDQAKPVDFDLFWKVWDILKEKYVDRSTLDAQQLFYGAIDGMLAATGDPYTTFFDPKEQKEFAEDLSGKFGGIGAEMGIRDEVLTVVAPLDGTPAERAGLLANDKILKINGEDSSGFSLEESVSKIRGDKGTEVKLLIYRNGEEAPREVPIVRDIINVKSVKLTFREDGIPVLKVSLFGDDTDTEFAKAVADIISKNPKGLVVDLRNNPGGLLDKAVVMASAMLPAGSTVVIEEDGKGEQKRERARGGDKLSQIPTMILINEGSASASEILAGALKDNRANVTLVGKKSFGKGSVQVVIPTSKDTSVKITVARWLTPKGNQINEQGIMPDVDVDISADDIKNGRDPQLDRAIEDLLKSI